MEIKLGPLNLTRVVNRIAQFMCEAQRRRVWRTALAYAAVIFVLLQLGEIVFPAFGAPDSALRILVIASLLGFPLVLCLAWAFDITSGGIRRTGPEEGQVPGVGGLGASLPRLAVIALTLAIVGGIGWWTVEDTLQAEVPGGEGSPGDQGDPGGSPVAAGLEAVGTKAADELQIRSLAVLPLDDYSQGREGGYFTAGLHEELVSQLSQVGAARVLSRTSAVQYDRTGKTMPVIASELGVEGVVEGSVFRDGDRVRITVQLIHGATDQHLWANSYEGTLEDAIALQRTVAQAIAREIKAEIAPAETEKDETAPSRIASNPAAQDEYLKGRYFLSTATPEGIAEAARHYEASVENDSAFAPAFVGLAAARLLKNLQGAKDSIHARIDDPSVTEPLERAFLLDRDSPEGRQMILALHGSFGSVPDLELPEGLEIIVDSTARLETEFALVSSEFGRQLRNIVLAESDQATAEARAYRGGSRDHGAGDEPMSSVEAARALMKEDRQGEALAELRHALALKERELVSLWTDPVWDPLRADPRFRALLSDIRQARHDDGMLLPLFP